MSGGNPISLKTFVKLLRMPKKIQTHFKKKFYILSTVCLPLRCGRDEIKKNLMFQAKFCHRWPLSTLCGPESVSLRVTFLKAKKK